VRNANEEDSIDSAERRARAAAQQRRTRALAVRLRTLRAHRDLNQEQLSQAADVPRQIISGLEKGGRPRPEAETVERLARALGVSARQLRGCDPIPELSAADAELAAEAIAGDAEALEREGAVVETLARSAVAGPALGMTSLLTLPPGATVLQKYRPDGSVVLYVQIPATPHPAPPPPPDGAPHDAV
jgi:transcriptional regulator with XRE-family HTH domain